MSQHASDLTIANASGSVVRGDANDILEDIATLRCGTTAPANVSAGELFHDTDDGKVYVRNQGDTAWIETVLNLSTGLIGSAGILQASLVTLSGVASSASASWLPVTTLTINITPRNTSSRFAVIASLHGACIGFGHVRLERDGSPIGVGGASAGKIQAGGGLRVDDSTILASPQMILVDSPATASSVAYRVGMRSDGTNTSYLNRTTGDATNAPRTASHLIVLEIAG